MSLITPQLKAIDTRFDGNLYRSRLEARWAIFMKRLGIDFFYEHEGYDLDGLWYLPDFWLPTFNGGCYLEVKPTEFNNEEIEKAKRLVMASKSSCILAIGLPDFKCQEVYYYDNCSDIVFMDKYHGLMNADQAHDSNRMFVYPGYENNDLTIPKDFWSCLGVDYKDAVQLAKEARF